MTKTTKKLKKTTKVGAVRTVLPKIETSQTEPVQTAAPRSASTGNGKAHVNRISLELVKPEAHQVCVAGSFNDWKPELTPLAPVGNGRWSGELVVKPGRYEYLFVVDGQWLPDPNAKETVQNPFGGQNSVLIAAE